MPFTASHVAAALPFLRTPLFPAALVIGTLAPDLPYFVPLGVPRGWSHAWFGVLTIDLLIGIVAFACWHVAIREPVVDLLPAPVRQRIPRLGVLGWRPPGWGPLRVTLVLVAALVVGSTTHVVWDSATHPDGWLVLRLEPLRAMIGEFRAYRWLQHASTIAGLVALAAWSVVWFRRTRPDPARPSVFSTRARVLAWAAIVLGFGIAGLAIWVPGILDGKPPLDPSLVFRVARLSIAVAGVVTLLTVAAWHLLRWRR